MVVREMPYFRQGASTAGIERPPAFCGVSVVPTRKAGVFITAPIFETKPDNVTAVRWPGSVDPASRTTSDGQDRR